MGVVNVTPDSFSDGGRLATREAALAHALALDAAGADILDIGGESTRPGAEPVSADEEMARTLPLLRELRPRPRRRLSIDTCKPEVARAAVEAASGAPFPSWKTRWEAWVREHADLSDDAAWRG